MFSGGWHGDECGLLPPSNFACMRVDLAGMLDRPRVCALAIGIHRAVRVGEEGEAGLGRDR